jgi:hypothetical protein
MLTPVRLTTDTDALTTSAHVCGGMLFVTDEYNTVSSMLCDRTILDYGLGPEQFRQMVERDGLRQMLDYYPDAFLCVGQNRYIHCEIVTPIAHETEPV